MSSTTKKPTKSKTSSKLAGASSVASSSKGSEAAAKAALAKRSEAVLKGAAAKKNEAATKVPVTTRSKTPVAKKANPTLVSQPSPVVLGPVMRKKELIDAVVSRSGVKKKDAKPVVEGMLAVLGEALAEGRELKLPPLGKMLVRREKSLPNGKVMVVKVRQSSPPQANPPKTYTDAAE